MALRWLMPWRASAPGALTILRASGKRLGKLITPDRIDDYDKPLRFEVEAVHVDTIEDIAELLERLAPQTDVCIIRGLLKREFATRPQVLRRIHDHPDPGRAGYTIIAPFVEVPRGWVMIDLEPDRCAVDPADALLVGGWLRQQLPPAFRMARCVVQLSSGAGIKSGARGHLWFKLSRPLDGTALERWLGDVPGLDPATLRPIQIHYTANPIFEDVDDPVFERLAVLPGYAAVEVPTLAPAVRQRQALVAAAFQPGAAPGALAGSAERYAAACLRRLALAPEGRRHRACLVISCRLLELAYAGQLDPRRVGAQVKGVMYGKGFDGRSGRDLAEVDRILAWAWQTVTSKELPR